MFICAGCGEQRLDRRARKYCGLVCQREHERRRLVEKWLATGVAQAGSGRRHYVRLHIAEEQGGRCAVCGLAGEWNDLPLALVLDHVDGDATNNVRTNLRLICPNCDSQLETYKSKNRGRGRFSRRQRYAGGQSY